MTRRGFQRLSSDERRQALIAATFDVIADEGISAATTRNVAERAGVTPGLIRHYFRTKDHLLAAAYQQHLAQMDLAMAEGQAMARAAGAGPLVALLTASLSAPVVDARNLAIWAGFISRVPADPTLAAIHAAGYQALRAQAEEGWRHHCASLSRVPDALECRRMGIAVNALIDGLWLEASLSAAEISTAEMLNIGLRALAALMRDGV